MANKIVRFHNANPADPDGDTVPIGVTAEATKLNGETVYAIDTGATLIGGGDASAANQTLQLTQATTTNTNLGPVTETAPTTDTASSGLNGRLQRLAQRITSLIALLPTALGAGGGLKVDGSGTALPVSGTVTATVADQSGTDITTPSPAMPAGGVGIRGWLSAIWTKINASLAVTGTFFQAVQPVMSGAGAPVVVKFTRPAPTTAYTCHDNVSTILDVTGATNASPIVVTTTQNHLLSDGDYVTISGVGGNTAANVSCYVKVTTYSAATFALYSDKALTTPIAGNGAYSSPGVCARLFRLPNFLASAGGSGYIMGINMMTDMRLFTDQFRMWLYSAPVPAILDNIEKTILYANVDKRLGFITLPAFWTMGTASDCATTEATPGDGVSNLPKWVTNTETPASRDVWYMIENMTATPGTPQASQNFTTKVFGDN